METFLEFFKSKNKKKEPKEDIQLKEYPSKEHPSKGDHYLLKYDDIKFEPLDIQLKIKEWTEGAVFKEIKSTYKALDIEEFKQKSILGINQPPFYDPMQFDKILKSAIFKSDFKVYKDDIFKPFTSKTAPSPDIFNMNDIMDCPISEHLRPLDSHDQAATTIQTWWRQTHRAKYLHTSSNLFNTTKNTIHNRFYIHNIPAAFQPLAASPIPPIFETTKHYSSKLEAILHDGRIYSKDKSKVPHGFCNTIDIKRFDSKLVFTAPLFPYRANSCMTLDLKKLTDFNGGNSLYFKFFDWAMKSEYSVSLCPEVNLRVTYHFPNLVVQFLNPTNNDVITQVKLPGEDCVYHGYSGLNEYLTFFIFKVIELLPPQLDYLKNYIYSYFEKLAFSGDLINYLQSLMKTILTGAEIDFVNSIKLNFDTLVDITIRNSVYNFVSLKRYIKIDDVNFISTQFSDKAITHSYFIIFGILNYARENNAQKITQYITENFSHLLNLPLQVKLLERSKYVHENFLSKAYQENHLFIEDAELSIAHEIIYRPNHGLPHSLRSASYTQSVIDYFKQHCYDENFKEYCQNISPEDILDIQTALLFCVTGRESDLGFKDNPEAYLRYREASANNYEIFANKIQIPLGKIHKFREIIRYLGDPSYVDIIKPQGNKIFIFHIMNMSHKLDHMRCFSLGHYLSSIAETNGKVVKNSAEQMHALNQLFYRATEAILACGDRMFCQFKNGRMVECNRDYNDKIFPLASQQPAACFALIYNQHLPVANVSYPIPPIPLHPIDTSCYEEKNKNLPSALQTTFFNDMPSITTVTSKDELKTLTHITLLPF